ncbi:2-phosphosulfolactate phosphatase [Flexibacter flexilis DSM 6793]|uniref:Probable 2-phosphosulfolactate phosphatase n=1 Tax=Flexibacter flexilis DSM 6793 TaxID=927664 RepID=A0A1I1MWA0_9BACT|nr:2-phosphosulfolactate phosphatase [Flexibacter flexilis]SFC87518.1 2-phosphosulfolactate phosphatase [Flexibacter flexilis DSM 6793]
MKQIDVCLSPELLHLFDMRGKVVVVIDILRATSCMTVAMAHGVAGIIPVASLEECMELKAAGYITAAERDGKKAEGFDIGNSPFSYMESYLVGQTIGMTTTNGTTAIARSREAEQIIVGSFLNLTTVAEYLHTLPNDVVLLCSGWKGMANAEDTLYAGALVALLENEYSFATDAPILAKVLYDSAKEDMLTFLSASSHVSRLHNLNITEDIKFCLTPDQYSVIPVLKDGVLVPLTPIETSAN